MRITCECSKKEYDELIKQLRDEGLSYHATTQESLDEFFDIESIYSSETKRIVVFWYSGKLI